MTLPFTSLMHRVLLVWVPLLVFGGCASTGNTDEKLDEEDPKSSSMEATELAMGRSSKSLDKVPRVLYTSFDGVNDFSLLVLGEKTAYSSSDLNALKIEDLAITLSAEQEKKLFTKSWTKLKERKAKKCQGGSKSIQTIRSKGKVYKRARSSRFNCDVTFDDFKKILVTRFRIQRLTPSSSGEIKMLIKDREGETSQSRSRTMVVTNHDPAVFAAGASRYNDKGVGNLRPCASCHMSGDNDAPPHALGRIKSFSDADVMGWITTGGVGENRASVPHEWEFSSEEQEKGIVPYLRSLQAKDTNSLLDAYISDLEDEFEDGLGG